MFYIKYRKLHSACYEGGKRSLPEANNQVRSETSATQMNTFKYN